MGGTPPNEVRDCYLGTLNDLNTTDMAVRDKIAEYIQDLINIGVKGFRVDAAKHMWPKDLKYIMVNIANGILRQDYLKIT